MNACAEFLRSGILASDAREAEMIRLYDQALVQWILRDAPPGEELRRRTDERRALVPESGRLQ
jgi:hypothetical protein